MCAWVRLFVRVCVFVCVFVCVSSCCHGIPAYLMKLPQAVVRHRHTVQCICVSSRGGDNGWDAVPVSQNPCTAGVL